MLLAKQISVPRLPPQNTTESNITAFFAIFLTVLRQRRPPALRVFFTFLVRLSKSKHHKLFKQQQKQET